MGLPNVMLTGRSGMMAARSAIGTTGHNIANANTEGYNRQRVELETQEPTANQGYKGFIGRGTQIARVSRINDEYLDKQIRNGNRSLQFMEEKDLSLRQTEDIFNEMNGEGLNRLMAKFFNEFRQLANDPNSEAIRQSVREATNAMTSDFKRMRGEVDDVRRHIDNRIEGYTREVNQLADQIANMNQKILQLEIGGGSPNDLLDQRDLAVKKLASYMDVSVHKSKNGSVTINIVGAGPLVTGPKAEQFNVQRSPRDDDGKPENALDIYSSSSANSNVTHVIKGGKLGALVEVRDQTLGTILSRMDDLAFGITESVNAIHRQGLTRDGVTGIDFFKPQTEKFRAAEYFGLSDDILASSNNIATAAQP
ncbi:MAG: flagellar hook-associated protein FlgK, partial [Bacteriovoracia bacterium]